MTTDHHIDYESLSDAELMVLVKSRQKYAFSAIVKRHQNAMLNFFRHLGVYNDAEDLAQETFLRLFKYRNRYKPKAKFTTFLYMMARQVRIDMLRKLKRTNDLSKKLNEANVAAENEVFSGTEPDIDAEELLRSLPEGMRSVVVLNIYQGFRYQEIADVLEIPVGTVKSRMFNALRQMKALINDR
ncbi:MAG: RNA polymerase sigma factor [Kiritimatiellae bacterium]|nr:RNA polymerase sigma factor [Kiritimatiellia bacterium]